MSYAFIFFFSFFLFLKYFSPLLFFCMIFLLENVLAVGGTAIYTFAGFAMGGVNLRNGLSCDFLYFI